MNTTENMVKSIVLIVIILTGCFSNRNSDISYITDVFRKFLNGDKEYFCENLSRVTTDSIGFIRYLDNFYDLKNTTLTVGPIDEGANDQGDRIYRVFVNSDSFLVALTRPNGLERELQVDVSTFIKNTIPDRFTLDNYLNQLFYHKEYLQALNLAYLSEWIKGWDMWEFYKKMGQSYHFDSGLRDSCIMRGYFKPVHYYIEALLRSGRFLEGLKLYERLGSRGDARSMYLLARYTDEYYIKKGGHYVPNEYKEFNYIQLYRKSLDVGYGKAAFGIGISYLHGSRYCNQNVDSAKHYLRIACKSGTLAAHVELANIMVTENKISEAISELESAYNQGYGSAAFDLGRIYEVEVGDLELAVKWYKIGWEEHASYSCLLRLRSLDPDNHKRGKERETLLQGT